MPGDDMGYMAISIMVTRTEMTHSDSDGMKALLLYKCGAAYKEFAQKLGLYDGTYDISRELENRSGK